MKNTNIASLKSFFTAKSYQVQDDPNNEQIIINFKLHEQEFPMFVRMANEGELVQLLCFMPFEAKKTALSDLARLLHFINKEVDIPGFGMDEEQGITFFRCLLPVLDGEISDKILEGYIKSIEMATETFAPAIATVAQGAMTFEEVIKKTQEAAEAAIKENKP
jgi:hypothetical protein